MNHLRPVKRRTALITALALASGSLAATGALPASALGTPAVVQESPTDTVDYFDYAYDNLGADSVYETVTFERFEFLLKSEGTFAFLIGGPDSENTNATIGHINDVAKQYGVSKVYNFNPKLDGDKLDIRDASALPVESVGQDAVEALWTRLVADYLSKDTQTPFTNDSSDPYLFVYDKGHQVEGAEDRIISALDVTKTAADLATPTAVTEYRAQVASVFDAVSNTSAGQPVAQIDTSDNFTFYETEVDRRHAAGYSDASKYGADILDDSDNVNDWRIQSITYPELVHILQSEGDYVIFFGGTWCHNTRAVIKQVNADAQKNGVAKVYNFDLSLDSTGNASSNYLHIRDSARRVISGTTTTVRASYLYGDLVNTYLTNLQTQYVPPTTPTEISGTQVSYYPNGDTTQPYQVAKKLQVPFPIHYNKDNVDAEGNPAPVVHQWIQTPEENGTANYKEYMTEWWWVKGGLDGPYTAGTVGWDNNVPNLRAFAAEGITKLGQFFTKVAGGYISTVGVTEFPTTAVVGEDVTATVGVTAPDFDGIPTGTVTAVSGETTLAEADLSEGSATLTLSDLPAGTHSVVFRYSGDQNVADSESAAQELTVTKVASTTTVTAAKTTYGKAGKAVVTVANAGEKTVSGSVTVTVGGTTQTKELSNGKATFALGKGIVAKSHTLKATYSGNDELNGSSKSASYVVAKGKVTSVKYANGTRPTTKKAGKATVTISVPSGLAKATGTAKVTLKKGKSTKTISVKVVSGKASVKLPKLAKGTWKASVAYAGNTNYLKATSSTYSLKVTK